MNGVVRETAQEAGIAGGPGVLEAAHAHMAARDPGEHRSRQQAVALHRTTRRHDGKGPVVGMPNACIASLTRYSRNIGPTTARPSPFAGKRRVPGALEVDILKAAVGAGELAEQERPAVAQSGGSPAKLVAG